MDINGHLEGNHVFYYMNQGKTIMRDMESRIYFSKNVYLFRVKVLLSSLGIREEGFRRLSFRLWWWS